MSGPAPAYGRDPRSWFFTILAFASQECVTFYCGRILGDSGPKFCLKKEIDLPKRGGLALDLSPESRPIIRGVD